MSMTAEISPPQSAIDIAVDAMKMYDANPPKGYETDRSAISYLYALRGVEELLTYIEALTTNPLLLDVGAGTARGVHELASIAQRLGYNTRFAGTVLDKASVHSFPQHPKIPIIQTSVEKLEGIEDRSVAAITGVHSVQYSADPTLSVSQIDRVLIPGGVFKVVYTVGLPKGSFASTQHNFKELEDEFWRRGYDLKSVFYSEEEDHTLDWVLLGIKSGTSSQSAATLSYLDRQSLNNQRFRFGSNGL